MKNEKIKKILEIILNEADKSFKDSEQLDSLVAKAKASGIYQISWNNLGKKIPPNYDNLVIPEIERITKYIPSHVIKYQIYNYIIYYYNKGITEGILETIDIYSSEDEIVKQVAFKIDDNSIRLKLVPKGTTLSQLKKIWNS